MDPRDAANRDVLFGLIALQNALIDQDVLVAALRTWTRDKSRPIAEILSAQGAIEDDDRALLEGLAARHLKRHDGDAQKSLAALCAGLSTRESLERIGDPVIDETLAHVGFASTEDENCTANYSVGTSTSEGLRFRVLRPHAKGGLGAVFVALDGELHREVALKQILDRHADDPASRQRFLVEAEITGGLEHPGIVPVYGLGTYDDGRPYYAMRFIKGDSLKEAIERFHVGSAVRTDSPSPTTRKTVRTADPTGLELRRLLRRFIDVCNALEYAHSRGVLHRDIKPGNIIVGKYGETLVVDWGLAKPLGKTEPGSSEESPLYPTSASGSAETLPGSAMGTPAYMSPEQARGDLSELGPYSDVYSLGATLYCLLTGKAPFAGDDVGAVLRKVQAGEFSAPRLIDPSIDKGLEAICLKAMATNPEDRYPRCRALADDIERWTADEPVLAYREPFGRRARRWAKRNRTAVSSAAVALVAGVVGLSAVTAVQANSNAALTKANGETRDALADTRRAQKETLAALGQSEESRKQAEAVGTFLVHAFKKPDPNADGKDVKLADVLDQAMDGLAKEFSGSKAIKGALLDALGQSYFGLGLYPKAEEAHRKAQAVREAALGTDHPDTLTSRNNLANVYLAAGRTAEAIAVYEATLKRCDSKLGPHHPDTLTIRNNLALAYRSAGRIDEAIPIFEATFKQHESELGPDHPSTLTSRNNLALAYQDAGLTAKAIPIYEATVSQYESKLGPDHPATLMSRNNLATAYLFAGRTAEAITLHEATLKRQASKLGLDHPDTLMSRGNLASAYLSAGRTAEAIAMHEATLKEYESKLGPDHPGTLASRRNLADLYRSAGRNAEAIPIFEATLKQYESKLGLDHPSTLVSRNNLAGAYGDAGRIAEAIPIYEVTLRQYESKLGPDHPDTLTCRNNLGTAYLSAGRTAQAVAMHEVTLKRFESKLGPDHPTTLTSRNNLATAYQAAGRTVEAVAMCEATLKVRESKLGPDHPSTLSSRVNLATAYEALNDWADAEALRRENLARRRTKEKPDSPLLANDLAGLGRSLLKQSRWSEAEPVLRECLAIRVKAIPDDYRRFSTESQLGGAWLGQGKYAEAEPLIVGGYKGLKTRKVKISAPVKYLLSEAEERVVRLYKAWGKPEQARVWADKLGLGDLPDDVFAK